MARATSAFAKIGVDLRQKAAATILLATLGCGILSCTHYVHIGSSSKSEMLDGEEKLYYYSYEDSHILYLNKQNSIFAGEVDTQRDYYDYHRLIVRQPDGEEVFVPLEAVLGKRHPNHKLAGTEVEFAPLLDIPGFKIVYGTVAAVYLREGKTWDAESEVLVPFPRVPSAFTVTVHSGIDFDGHEVDINPPYNVFMRAPRVNWGRVAE